MAFCDDYRGRTWIPHLPATLLLPLLYVADLKEMPPLLFYNNRAFLQRRALRRKEGGVAGWQQEIGGAHDPDVLRFSGVLRG